MSLKQIFDKMTTNKCDHCDVVGKKFLSSIQFNLTKKSSSSVKRPHHGDDQEFIPPDTRAKSPKKIYNLGHGKTTLDVNEAKDRLLQRDFPHVARLEKISEEDFRQGMIGVNYLPEVSLSQIPEVAEPAAMSDSIERIKRLFSTQNNPKDILESMNKEQLYFLELKKNLRPCILLKNFLKSH